MNTILTPMQKLKELNHLNRFLLQAQKLASRYTSEGKQEIATGILAATSKVTEVHLLLLPSFYCKCGKELKADIELKHGKCFNCANIN